MKSSLNKIFNIIEEKKFKFIFLSFGSLLSSIFDIIGIGMVGPLVISFLDPDLLQTFLIKYLPFDSVFFAGKGNTKIIIILCVILLISFSLKSLVSFLITKEIIKVGFDIQKELRNKFIQIFQSLSYEDFIKKKTSELLHAINHLTIVFCQNTIVKMFILFSETIILISVIIFLFFINAKITMLILLTLSLIYLFYFIFIRKKMSIYGTTLGEADQQFLDFGKITMEGFKEIRILQKENFFFDEYKKISKKFADVHLKYDTTLILPKFLLESSIILVIMIMTISIVLFSDSPSKSIPLIGIFAVSAARIIPLVYNILNSIGTIIGSSYSIQRIDQILSQNKSSSDLVKKQNINKDENYEFNNIKFENVSFDYDKNNIIDDQNLILQKGEIVGISGDSGSGKTTFVNLIIGFLKPKKGKILVNDKNIFDDLKNWQSMISYISQQNFVYGASIIENITLEKDSNKINLQKFNNALKSAHLLEFVSQLSDKENTVLSDNVLNISGGQKQRIAIARSFYFNRDFIILDESLNALQEELQEQIIKDLKNNKNKLTVIIVSHYKKNLKLCDYILELKNKKIVKINKET